MGNLDGAMEAYEHALRHNQWSIQAMNQISAILRTKEQFPKAVEYLQNILKIDGNNGEVWGSLGSHQHSKIQFVRADHRINRTLLFDDG
jgi:tetratricopeptide (TPR) repeat protein